MYDMSRNNNKAYRHTETDTEKDRQRQIHTKKYRHRHGHSHRHSHSRSHSHRQTQPHPLTQRVTPPCSHPLHPHHTRTLNTTYTNSVYKYSSAIEKKILKKKRVKINEPARLEDLNPSIDLTSFNNTSPCTHREKK